MYPFKEVTLFVRLHHHEPQVVLYLQLQAAGLQAADSVLQPGMQPQVDEERLQGNRWAIRQRLLRATRPRFSLLEALDGLRRKPLLLTFQGAAMAMAFLIGVMVASSPQTDIVPAGDNLVARQIALPFEFIGEDIIEHISKNQPVQIRLGAAFDLKGTREQTEFKVNEKEKWLK